MKIPVYHGAHATAQLGYHFVWVTKRRRPVLDAEIGPVVDREIRDLCHTLGYPVLALTVAIDHIHLAIAAFPQKAPAAIARLLKAETSRQLAIRFPRLVCPGGKRSRIWATGYFVASMSNIVTADTIQAYINKHNPPAKETDP